MAGVSIWLILLLSALVVGGAAYAIATKMGVGVKDARTHVIAVIAVVAFVAIGATEWGVMHGGRSSPSTRLANGLTAAEDPVFFLLKNDIETPATFVVDAQGVWIFPNGKLSEAGVGGGGLVPASYTYNVAYANHDCTPKSLSYKFAPDEHWLSGNVLMRLLGHGVVVPAGKTISPGTANEYAVSTVLDGARLGWYSTGNWCERWMFYNFGQFKLADAQQINEWDGPDKQTGSTTKFRSYKVHVVFVPSAALKQAASQVDYGHYEWTVAIEKNPITAEWVLYQVSDASWQPSASDTGSTSVIAPQ